MKKPRLRWSGVIFIAFLRLSDDGQRFRQERAYQGEQLRPIERCYRHRWILGREEVGLAITRLRTRHACLLRDEARRATSFARHRARGGVRVDTPTGAAGSPSPSLPPPDPPSSRSAFAPACRPAGGWSERLRRHDDCAP